MGTQLCNTKYTNPGGAPTLIDISLAQHLGSTVRTIPPTVSGTIQSDKGHKTVGSSTNNFNRSCMTNRKTWSKAMASFCVRITGQGLENALIAPLLNYWHKLSPQEVLKCPLLTHKGQNVPASLTLQPPHHRTVGPDNGLVIQAQAVFTTTCVGLILVSAERNTRTFAVYQDSATGRH
ncbi:hypothetical protein Bbelb_197880 [Branchiostoma belcheri]|nr:hypothetical protein Bbelb_197880 [Branchiostoma belcheri]